MDSIKESLEKIGRRVDHIEQLLTKVARAPKKRRPRRVNASGDQLDWVTDLYKAIAGISAEVKALNGRIAVSHSGDAPVKDIEATQPESAGSNEAGVEATQAENYVLLNGTGASLPEAPVEPSSEVEASQQDLSMSPETSQSGVDVQPSKDIDPALLEIGPLKDGEASRRSASVSPSNGGGASLPSDSVRIVDPPLQPSNDGEASQQYSVQEGPSNVGEGSTQSAAINDVEASRQCSLVQVGPSDDGEVSYQSASVQPPKGDGVHDAPVHLEPSDETTQPEVPAQIELGGDLHIPDPAAQQDDSITVELVQNDLSCISACDISPVVPDKVHTSTEGRQRSSQTIALKLTKQPKDSRDVTFQCSYQDLAPLNEAMFKSFSSCPDVRERGYFKLRVDGLPRVNTASFKPPGKEHSTNFSCHRDAEGFVKITQEVRSRVKCPSFPSDSPKQAWSTSEMKELWEKTVINPPSKFQYVIGQPLFDDLKLSPGKKLEIEQLGRELAGITNSFVYLSYGPSLSISHAEDAYLRSMNIVRAGGPKFLLTVKPAYREKLVACMRQVFPDMADCSQAVRHLSRVIPPSKLDQWNIPYSLDFFLPGEGFVTEPEAFHQILNIKRNYALAINILYSSSPYIPKGYIFCQKKCDPHAVTAADLTPDSQVYLGGRKHRAGSVAHHQQKKQKTIPSLRIEDLCKAICSKEAFQRLCSLVASWRDHPKPLFESTLRLVQVIETMEIHSDFVTRLAKVKVAEAIEKENDGRLRTDPAIITKFVKENGWEDNKRNRQKIAEWSNEGRKWKRIIGKFDGLLSLVPPNRADISGSLYLNLSSDETKELHDFLESNEFLRSLSRMGHTLETSMLNNSPVPEFKWESQDRAKLARLSLKELGPFLDEFEIITANEWVSNYNWPKPDRWDGAWPQNPASVSPSDESRCDDCDKKDCQCILMCLPKSEPRITTEGGKGQGVRATEMYPAGQVLGELFGQFVPLGTFNDGWPVEFTRPDLNDEPVAQLYPGKKGNWVRKVNHACSLSATAEFRVQKKSGWWRYLLIARVDIPCNGEITVYCGKTFISGQGKKCLCDECK
jgi:hypothetical protein